MTNKLEVDEKHMNEVEFLHELDNQLKESQEAHEERLKTIFDMRKELAGRIMRLNWRD